MRLRSWLRKLVHHQLSRKGYQRSSMIRPVDLRGLGLSLSDAVCRSPDTPFLFDVPVTCCRTLVHMGFGLGEDSLNPYYVHSRLRFAGASLDAAHSPLRLYFENWRPANAAEVLGINEDSALTRIPALQVEFPWRNPPGPHAEKRRSRCMRMEALAHGFEDVQGSDGWHLCGPVTDKKLEMERLRTERVIESVGQFGLREGSEYGYIAGIPLRSGASFRVLVKAGQHRAAVAAASGISVMPMLINPESLVDVADVERWPAVRSGHFTVNQASDVFSRIMNGDQPSAFAETALKLTRLKREELSQGGSSEKTCSRDGAADTAAGMCS